MVGVGTVLADDPRLTVRLAVGRDPLRVVADSRLRTPPDAAVLRDGVGPGTILAHTAAAPADLRATLAATGATLLELPESPGGGVDLAALLMALAARGVQSLMVEGGARLITAMLRMRLASHLAVTIAPKILGAGTDSVGDLGIARLGDAYTLADVAVTPYGADIVIAGRFVYP
jgi:5-amino-6-(5-phosphoribosylamino)uracil reductase/diaminohydroxyphosphoribosylaminopyrimidine deaminase/5-amino-6-(5-phosphoribosylamino)uracil reductase